MRSRSAFLPPKNSPLVERLVKLILPWLFRGPMKGLRVVVPEADLARLKAIKGKRMLLLPNHPSPEDPYILFDLSRQLDESFNYVAAREIFDHDYGARGWVLQHCGSYSIIRGKADRESFMMTKELLIAGMRRLVIFIEGEVSNENDTVIPFEIGVIQLAFKAQEELAKQSGDYPGIFVAPVALKFFFDERADIAIEQSLRDLEAAVGLTDRAQDTYERIMKVSDKLLSVHERQMTLKPDPSLTLSGRIQRVKNRLLKKMELFLEITPPPEMSYLDRVRVIRNQMDHLIHTYHDPGHLSDYETRMLEHLRGTFAEFYDDLERLVNFMTMDEGYLRDRWTRERFVELLRRLEKEVYGAARIQAPRTVVVRVGDIFNLKDRFPEYQKDKKAVAQAIASEIEADMTHLLATAERPV